MNVNATWCLSLLAAAALAACGGGGTSSSASSTPSGNAPSNTVQGVSTPSSVSVVTATNTPAN